MISETVRRRLDIQVLISLCSTLSLLWVIWTFVFPFSHLQGLYLLILLTSVAASSFVISIMTLRRIIAMGLHKSLRVFWLSAFFGVLLTLTTFLLVWQWQMPHNPQSLYYRGFPIAYWGSLFWYPTFYGRTGEWLFGIYLFSFILDVLFWLVLSFVVVSGSLYFKKQYPWVIAGTLLSCLSVTLATFEYGSSVYGGLAGPVAIAHGFPWAFFQSGIYSSSQSVMLWYGLVSDILFWYLVSYPFVVAIALLIQKRVGRGRRRIQPLDARV